MAGPTYGSSVALTVTNLHSLPADNATGAPLVGWFSAAKSNLTDLRLDYNVSGSFTTHASNRQAGFIYVYAVASLNDTPLWPATATGTLGTEGLGSFVDVEERDSYCVPLATIVIDNTASAIYTFPPTSIASAFGLIMPPTHWGLFVSTNATTTTTAALAASGSALYYTPIIAP